MKTILATVVLLTISCSFVASAAPDEPVTPPVKVTRPAQKPGEMHLEIHSSPTNAVAPTVADPDAGMLPIYQSDQLEKLREHHARPILPFGPAYRDATYGQPQAGEPVGLPWYP